MKVGYYVDSHGHDVKAGKAPLHSDSRLSKTSQRLTFNSKERYRTVSQICLLQHDYAEYRRGGGGGRR